MKITFFPVQSSMCGMSSRSTEKAYRNWNQSFKHPWMIILRGVWKMAVAHQVLQAYEIHLRVGEIGAERMTQYMGE